MSKENIEKGKMGRAKQKAKPWYKVAPHPDKHVKLSPEEKRAHINQSVSRGRRERDLAIAEVMSGEKIIKRAINRNG